MGAEVFSCVGDGKTVEEAFHNAREEAFYWFGHSGYTGTIAEKESYIVFDHEGVLTLAEAEIIEEKFNTYSMPSMKGEPNPLADLMAKYGEDTIMEVFDCYDDKWGPAVAIPLKNDQWFFCGWASS